MLVSSRSLFARRILTSLSLLAMAFAGTQLLAASAANATSGAIFTTTPDGGIVNENVRYNDKRAVYLDGGPGRNAPARAAGLRPAGWYVFQVTNPSGRVLLSEDPAKCRVVEVSDDGVIIDRVPPGDFGLDNTWDKTVLTAVGKGNSNKMKATLVETVCHIDDDPGHPTDTINDACVADDPDDPRNRCAGQSGQHDTNEDLDHFDDAGAVVVQLMPYGSTPNPGGVYKAWMIPFDDYLADGGDLDAEPNPIPSNRQRPHKCPNFCADPDDGFGGARNDSKTDNFKVREDIVLIPDTNICVKKFHDLNADGVMGTGEPEIGKLDSNVVCLPFDDQNLQCVETDGTLDEDCSSGGGWKMFLTEPTEPGVVTNEAYTLVEVLNAPTGQWEVEEQEYPGDWAQSATYRCDGQGFQSSIVKACGTGTGVDLGITNPVIFTPIIVPIEPDRIAVTTIVFGNYMPASIHGRKVIDDNNDGNIAGDTCPADGEPNSEGCIGVEIRLTGTPNLPGSASVSEVTYTCGNETYPCPDGKQAGEYWFTDLTPGTYQVAILSEPTDFVCTYPSGCAHSGINLGSGQRVENKDFGDFKGVDVHARKFHDRNANGTEDLGDVPLRGVPFCIIVPGDGASCDACFGTCGTIEQVDGAIISRCMSSSGESAAVWWTNLTAGQYTVCEEVPEGSFPTTVGGASQTTEVLGSCDEAQLVFGNADDCDGLTPGYWKNWRNHYTDEEFVSLLPGTIAANINEVDAIFDDYNAGDCNGCNPITILKAMLLANQLTLNLTQTDLFNAGFGGNLFRGCIDPDAPAACDPGTNLGDAIDTALALLDPDSRDRNAVIDAKTCLDAYANLDN